MTQKQYFKNEMQSQKTLSTPHAIKKMVSIMCHAPLSPIPPATPPFSPFCYLPPGQFVSAHNSLVCSSRFSNKHTIK